MERVTGKKALVTGAATGIGRACAEMLAEEGARVCLSDINEDGARAAAAAINEKIPGAAVHVRHDVTDVDDWTRAVAAVEKELGGLNILVNNAGICIPGSVESIDIADWDRTIDVDLKSVFLGCRVALPVMAKYAPGAIVNISSISGLIASQNFSAYNAAKAGVWMLTKSVALHAAREGYEIRVNSVHPAFVDTEMVKDVVGGGADREEAGAKLARQVPLRRIATPRDIAFAVLYLASEEASFVTGAELKLDGGISAM